MECLTPYIVKQPTGKEIPVPCGKCPSCTARRVSQWSFRLVQEEKVSHSAIFLTLTYDTEHVPITKHGFMSLRRRDLQLFFKRLRKLHTGCLPIRYYAVGEYGTKTKRPHYHIILYNATPADIGRSWGLGDIHYGTVTGASIGYTLKYISKPQLIPQHAKDDREPGKALMSKGLGAAYLTDRMRAYHLAEPADRFFCTTEDQKKICLPRYYKNKLWNKEQLEKIGITVRQAALINQAKARLSYKGDFDSDQEKAKLAAFLKQAAKNRSTSYEKI